MMRLGEAEKNRKYETSLAERESELDALRARNAQLRFELDEWKLKWQLKEELELEGAADANVPVVHVASTVHENRTLVEEEEKKILEQHVPLPSPLVVEKRVTEKPVMAKRATLREESRLEDDLQIEEPAVGMASIRSVADLHEDSSTYYDDEDEDEDGEHDDHLSEDVEREADGEEPSSQSGPKQVFVRRENVNNCNQQ